MAQLVELQVRVVCIAPSAGFSCTQALTAPLLRGLDCEQAMHSSDRVSIGFCPFESVGARRRKASDEDDGDAFWGTTAAAPGSAGTVPPTTSIPDDVLSTLRVDWSRHPSDHVFHCIGCSQKARSGRVSLNDVSVDGMGASEADSGSWFQRRFRDVLVGLGLASDSDPTAGSHTASIGRGSLAGQAEAGGRQGSGDTRSPLAASSASGASASESLSPGARSTGISQTTADKTPSGSIRQDVWLGLCAACLP